LNITAPGVTYLDPKAMMINPKGDNIFNFTTITIAAQSILKISELRVHGPVYFLAQGDVNIDGEIDISGDPSPSPTASVVDQIPGFAGSGGYSGGLGGVHGDPAHQALSGNGPGGGAAGDLTGPQSGFPGGGLFTANRFLVPLIGGSGGGGANDNGQFGSQGGAGGGALLIASSTKIVLNNTLNGNSIGFPNGSINARGGSGGNRGCGGASGAIRLVANSLVAAGSGGLIFVDELGGNCSTAPQNGLVRLESLGNNNPYNVSTTPLISLPFALNLPTAPPPVITVTSISGMPINANPFRFPDATINTSSPVPVVINATNMPTNATVFLYTLSDGGANQKIPVTLSGNTAASQATVNVLFPSVATRGFVQAKW
jgi:hypothetical protein